MEGEVGRLVANVGFEAGLAADSAGPVPGGIALGLHDPRPVCESCELRRLAVRWGGQQKRILEEKLSMQAGQSRRRLSRVLLGDDQVELVRDKRPQRCAFVLLMHVDAKLWMLALKQLYGR